MSATAPIPEEQPDLFAVAARITAFVDGVIRGKANVTALLLTALYARGHVLIEDIPGVGKTSLARALAAAVGGRFRRIQFTADMLPSDIIGVSVYNQQRGDFEFKPGPLFANLVLADEINRATPRTQSALLEALNEGQVTVDNVTHRLDGPFMVIATQNPVEHFGTYPLPESQMDRFALRLSVGYPSESDEREILTSRGGDPLLAEVTPVVSLAHVRALQRAVDEVFVDSSLLDYAMTVVQRSRNTPLLALGISPRGAITWYRAAQALALVNGRTYCTPDDLKQLALPCLAHRVILASPAELTGHARDEAERVLTEILEGVDVPM